MPTARSSSVLAILVFLVVLVGCISRFAALDADPHYSGWWGHVADEGRWLRRARSLALGSLSERDLGDSNSGVAPAFEAAGYVSFRVFGVGRIPARIFSAISGSLILVGLWFHLRSRASVSAQLAAFAIVAFQADLFILSRTAVPEVPAMLASLITFCVIVSAPLRRRWFVVAGVALALTLGLKVTTFGLVPIFGLLVWLRRPPGSGWLARLLDLAAFWMVAALTGLLVAVIGLVVFDLDFAWFAARYRLFMSFIDLDDLYSIVSVLFEKSALPIVPPLLGLSVSTLGLLLFPRTGTRDDLYYANLAAVVWGVGLLVLMSVLAYYPVRYQIHVLLPLALGTAYGITRLERVGLNGIAAVLSAATGLRGAAALVVLVLPTAVLLATVASGIVGLLGVPSDRSVVQIVLVAAFMLILYFVIRHVRGRPAVVGLFLAIPVAGSLIWFLVWVLHPGAIGFWSSMPSAAEAGIRTLLTAAVIALAMLATMWGARSPSAPLVCFAMAWLGISAIHIAPGVFQPRFTLRDASIDLGRTVAHASSITSRDIEGIFLDNTLAYDTYWDRSEEDRPEIIVARLHARTPEYRDLGYEVVKVYDIYLSKLYALPQPIRRPDLCPGQKGICVAVYQRANP